MEIGPIELAVRVFECQHLDYVITFYDYATFEQGSRSRIVHSTDICTHRALFGCRRPGRRRPRPPATRTPPRPPPPGRPQASWRSRPGSQRSAARRRPSRQRASTPPGRPRPSQTPGLQRLFERRPAVFDRADPQAAALPVVEHVALVPVDLALVSCGLRSVQGFPLGSEMGILLGQHELAHIELVGARKNCLGRAGPRQALAQLLHLGEQDDQLFEVGEQHLNVRARGVRARGTCARGVRTHGVGMHGIRGRGRIRFRRPALSTRIAFMFRHRTPLSSLPTGCAPARIPQLRTAPPVRATPCTPPSHTLSPCVTPPYAPPADRARRPQARGEDRSTAILPLEPCEATVLRSRYLGTAPTAPTGQPVFGPACERPAFRRLAILCPASLLTPG